MKKRRANNKLPTNLAHLQNAIKRDPQSYHDEFLLQFRHYETRVQIFSIKPGEFDRSLNELMTFLSQISHCYPQELSDYPQQLMDLLTKYRTQLNPELRMTMCKALILMRNKNLLAPTDLLRLFFQLLECPDKTLRKFLQLHIVTDIKGVNSKHKNAKLNTSLQNFMFDMLRNNSAVAAKVALNIMIELYRKQVWNDVKTVNVIAAALLHKLVKIQVTALQFFLGADDAKVGDKDGSDSDSDAPTAKDIAMAYRVNKKSRGKQTRMEKAKKVLKKQKKSKKAPEFNFSALHLLHDPQGLVEKLFQSMQGSNERYEVRLMQMNLVSRLIGLHQLILLNFYGFMQRFLKPHQKEVVQILSFLAQSSHELVPPDALEPVLKTIIDNFVNNYSSVEVMTVGLNAVKELCSRSPLLMSEDTMGDLSQYKTHKDKGVACAARGLIQVMREVNPSVLHRKDKGRPTEANKNHTLLQYGQVKAPEFVAGAEVLGEKQVGQDQEEVEEGDAEWESASEDSGSESEEEWVTVSHSSDDEEEVGEAGVEEGEELGMTAEEKLQKATELSTMKIFTQEEFQQIKLAQLSKQVNPAQPKWKAKKRKAMLADKEDRNTNFVSIEDIEGKVKKQKMDKEARLAGVMGGREGRQKFGQKRGKLNPHSSTTNKQKSKGKAFMMVRHKIKGGKVKRSFRDKQVALRNSLLKKKFK